MEESLNEFSKIHLKALREDTYYTLIRGDINYERFIKEATSIDQIYGKFINGIKFEDGSSITLPKEDIIGFYALHHKNFTPEEITFLTNVTKINSLDTLGKYIEESRRRIAEMKSHAKTIGTTINIQLSTMETYQPIQYEILENNEEKHFRIYINDNGEIERNITESDTLDVFEGLEPNFRYPVVIYSNPSSELRYKCSKYDMVDFDAQFLIKLVLPPNSISIITKAGEITTLNFESGLSIIMTNPKKENDDKVEKIRIFFPMLIFIEEEVTVKKIIGKINFSVDNVIGYYSLYEYIITDPIVSTLFYIDETSRAWCSKDNFDVFFRDYSNEMINGVNIKTINSYFKFSIPIKKGESTSGFTVTFTTKSKEMMPSFLYKFSRLLSHFISLNIQDDLSKTMMRTNKVTIYTKPGRALIGEAPEFFKHLSKERGEETKMNAGKLYKKKCQAGDQPIIIKEDEVHDWGLLGRTARSFPPPEWGFKRQIWVVCPTDKKQIIVFQPNEQDETGRIKFLPCCSETGILKARTTADTIVSGTGRSGITEMVNNLSAYGTLNEALSRFLSLSFSKDGNFIFKKQGTVFKDQKFTFLNSSIIALLDATEMQLEDNIPLSIISHNEIIKNVNIIRSRMAMLPPDIYKQELYDMTDEEIIQSILDPNTYIDPYLYYRGLEIVFNVQIVTFTSNKGRLNPFSEEENNLPIASLEIPRCKYTHIRHRNDKDIVCLYKNYGSTNKIIELPACELIVYCDINEKQFAKRVQAVFTDFLDNIFDLIKRCCHPIEWERTSDMKIGDCLYDDPYSSVDWGSNNYGILGPIYGQEIDIYGKTTSLIFKDWTLIIPPTQPLAIYEPDYRRRELKIRTPDGKYHSHSVFASGVKKRPPLKTIEEVKAIFDISFIDDEGAWMEFNGKKRGIKIPYLTNKYTNGKNMNTVYKLIERKNNISILMQIINWLWRSDWTKEMGYPNFKQWWYNHATVDDSIIFEKVPKPLKKCNNYMFPRNTNNFEERLIEMTRLWPYFFYRKKIHVSKELYLRIQNFFQVEDTYSIGLTPDDVYGEPGRFITKLIPTDDDFKGDGSIILTEPEHIHIWTTRNNSSIFKYSSFFNANVIKESITGEMRKMIDYYFYTETIGDNSGQIYMIQNSAIPSQPPELSALNIANHWNTHERNPGPYYKKEEDIQFASTLNYVIYKIGPQGILEVAVDKSNGSNDYLQILNYDDEVYAAIIPLLVSSKYDQDINE